MGCRLRLGLGRLTLFICMLALWLGIAGALPAGQALAASGGVGRADRAISYMGQRIVVPASWPVFELWRDPATCVRFNRHAVYLGEPSSQQRCPPVALGRTEAILLEPADAHGGTPGGPLPVAPAAGPRDGSLAALVRGRVRLIATWGSDPAIVRRALKDPHIGEPLPGGGAGAPPVRHAARQPQLRMEEVAHASASTYVGLGFDTCSAPSPVQLQAWNGTSPFHAFGVYIGGANMACAQSNLTAAYVSEEVASGWHLIPTYVGLQAPGNSCGCAAITPADAAAQGTAAAQNAVAEAQALGIAAGNPIYYDMEAYPRTSSVTEAVLSFLEAWTAELHTQGYLSGVYSSDDSGIADLVAQWGSGYLEPDELWNAAWNGEQTTTDPAIPSDEWADNQRVHQFEGAHQDRYGNTTMDIDSDYLDAATVGTGGVVSTPLTPPTLSIAPQSAGTIQLDAGWSAVSGIQAWRLFGGEAPTAMLPLTGPLASGRIVAHDALPYFQVQALGSGGQVLGASEITPTPPHVAIFGRSVFVPRRGAAGLPVGCYTGSVCHLRVTVTAGRAVLASTGPERVAAGRGGIITFTPDATGQRLLAAARGHHLAVTVTVQDSSGAGATAPMNLIQFFTSGRAPSHASQPAPTLWLSGLTDFVYGSGTGGILAQCNQPEPCHVATQLVVGGRTIASTGQEFVGAHELAYLFFHLAPWARRMLARSAGNMLGASVTLRDGSVTAGGRITLVRFQ
jgi:hypothetical protein